jgi:RNA polymerase sigma factor for flagellar operon FliA
VDQERLVLEHLPLVGHIVREVLGRLPGHVSRDELVSAGTLALVLAARGFDPARGVPFAHFAAMRIRGAITDELRTWDWASRRVRVRSREVESVRSMLAARLSRLPSRDEVAQALGISIAELNALDADVHRASLVPLDRLAVEETAELVPAPDETPEVTLLRREQLGIMCDAIAELPERMRTVIERYYFEQLAVADIADELGVSEARIYQLRSEALQLLRTGMHACGVGPARAVPSRGPARPALSRSYTAAVSNRSTLAQRLSVSTVLGELLNAERHGDESFRRF